MGGGGTYPVLKITKQLWPLAQPQSSVSSEAEGSPVCQGPSQTRFGVAVTCCKQFLVFIIIPVIITLSVRRPWTEVVSSDFCHWGAQFGYTRVGL